MLFTILIELGSLLPFENPDLSPLLLSPLEIPEQSASGLEAAYGTAEEEEPEFDLEVEDEDEFI